MGSEKRIKKRAETSLRWSDKWWGKIWIQIVAPALVAVCLTLYGYAFNHEVFGPGMFLLVPFCVGLTIAYMSNGVAVMSITLLTSLILSMSVLLFAGFEGMICVILAFPILLIFIILGALVGWLIGLIFVFEYGDTYMILLSFGIMSLTGWTIEEPAAPKPLVVTSRMTFNAPMDKVWPAVVNSGEMHGNDSLLRFLGLPIPVRCTYSGGEERICYFEQGEMIQKVTQKEYGKCFEIEIIKSTFEVREWLTFENAGYKFIEKENCVEVIRTDTITSVLQPRWYWHWLETRCVQLEHSFVMKCMKENAER